ncbi:type II toxin-antitoxin system Phd/YefM family antitoxin, partial [Enterococcus hirae]
MDLKKLEVPTSSITEVKRSPMDVFDQARKAETGVYIFNREKVAGVMLTQEQYETLLQELADLRQKANEEVQAPIESNELLGNYTDQTAAVVSTSDGLDELVQTLKRYLITGVTISAKNLDERMVTLGFITKKTGFGGVVDMLNELTATGKINYQLRRKPNSRTVIAEIIGEQDSQSQLFDKII